MKKEILEWQCPVCSKVINSLYPRQLDANSKDHMRTHKKEENPKDEKS